MRRDYQKGRAFMLDNFFIAVSAVVPMFILIGIGAMVK